MSAKSGDSSRTGGWDQGTASHQTAAPQQATSDGSHEMARVQEGLDELVGMIRRAPTRNDKRALHETMRAKKAEHDTRMKGLRREREPRRASAQQQIVGRSPHQQRRPQEENGRRRKDKAKPLRKPTGGLHWGKHQMEKLKRNARKQRKEAEKKRNALKARANDLDQHVAGFEVALSTRMKEERDEGTRRREDEAAENQPAEGGYGRQQQWHDAIHAFHSALRNLGMSVSMDTTSGIIFSNINGQSFHVDNIKYSKSMLQGSPSTVLLMPHQEAAARKVAAANLMLLTSTSMLVVMRTS